MWKVKHDVSFSDEIDFLDTILKAAGVEDKRRFLSPSRSDILDPFTLDNMTKGITLLHDFLCSEEVFSKSVFVKVDCDVDGFTSASYLTQFIELINPDAKVETRISFNKEHGLKYEDVAHHTSEDLGLIFIPDASISVDEAKRIKDNLNVPIIILDHHIIEEKDRDIFDYATVINCTEGQYNNPYLSGVGVVHKFCEAYCQQFNLSQNIPLSYIDLVALGMIADSMSTISPENRYYIFEGLKEHNRHNELIKEIALANEEEMKLGHTITSYGWVIAPKINAAIRYGKEEEQINLFRAIKGEQESIEYQPRRKHKEDPKPPIEIHSLQKTMARVCNNIKQRQDTEVRKYVTKIDETIVAEKLNENSVIIINGTEIAMKNTVTGLVANKIASKYKRPVIILKSFSEEVFGGSGRNYGEGNLSNLKDFLEASNIFNKLAGHPNAFGIEIKKDKIIELTEYCNSHLSLADLITVHEVDYEILASRLKEQDVKDVAENYQIWGNSVPEPRFAITNIVIPAQEIQAYGENKNFIRFVYNGITFIKKYCSKNEYDEMTLKGRNTLGVNKKTLRMNVIGQFIMTSWEDKLIPEVKILHYDSEEWTNNNANKTATSIDDDFFF